MAVKKSELYSSLWKMCDELRGGMDASQYKDYVLVLLFLKYVSDRYAGNEDSLIEVPSGGSFDDMVELVGDKEIGEKINIIIGKLAEANNLRGVIDVADFNDEDKLGKGKDMVDRLSNLVKIFDNPSLDFRSNRADGDDLLGDAYEYLMRHFATESGKSKGQFYTPAEVSRIMSQVIGISKATSGSQTIYDPTCGSGSLLLKAHEQAKNLTGHDLTIYGQEMDNATSALSKMNMILHDCPTAEVWNDNTLSSPHFKNDNGGLKTFDYAVANPPFSWKAWSNGLVPDEDEFGRFAFGTPPSKNGDYAFLLHVLKSLKSTGKGCIVMPHGVLFRGNVESAIRTNILKRGYIKGIIGLPANLFYGTGIPACLIVLDKEHAEARKGIFMIDASDGFLKDGNKNRLREQDLHKIVDVFNNQIEVPKYSRMVPLTEINQNEFNLNIPRYIDSQQAEDIQDIEGHLRGGIPDRDIEALQSYWDVFPNLKSALFEPLREGYSQLATGAEGSGGSSSTSELKQAIYEHPEFVAFTEGMQTHFETWRKRSAKSLKSLDTGCRPKMVIHELSEDLLNHYTDQPLVDRYDVYQHLMDYAAEAMQDDLYLIAADGWKAETYRVMVKDKSGKEKDKGWACDLIPKGLIVSRYFASEQQALDAQQAELESLASQQDELEEEHGGEEGAFAELEKINKSSVASQLKQIKSDTDMEDEVAVLKEWQRLYDEQSKMKKAIKAADAALDQLAYEKYPTLSEDDVKSLAVDDKWLLVLNHELDDEIEAAGRELTSRTHELAQRYEQAMPQLEESVTSLEAAVTRHLESMGFAWN
ncbi:type I restriction-modification system subunit M [bacterium]|nr:type I restriction-modification system subunit M [bacterium]